MKPTAQFVYVRPSGEAEPKWVGLVTERCDVYVWVPKLTRFCFSTALSEDAGWNQDAYLEPIATSLALQQCEEGIIGRIVDPKLDWLMGELAAADNLSLDSARQLSPPT